MQSCISRRHALLRIGMAGTIGLVTTPLQASGQAGDPESQRRSGAAAGAGAVRVLLINPNSSQATTDMMVRIAQTAAPDGVEIVGATAQRSPPMITEPKALKASAPQVVDIGVSLSGKISAMIVSAFGDPGLADLRQRVTVPVVGIAESAMLAASKNGRRFGVATTTPGLVGVIDARASELGLARLYTGTRLAPGDPLELSANPGRLVEALRQAVSECIELDKAEAVIIGGGPLGNAATALAPMFQVPVIAPIPQAVRRLTKIMGLERKPG